MSNCATSLPKFSSSKNKKKIWILQYFMILFKFSHSVRPFDAICRLKTESHSRQFTQLYKTLLLLPFGWYYWILLFQRENNLINRNPFKTCYEHPNGTKRKFIICSLAANRKRQKSFTTSTHKRKEKLKKNWLLTETVNKC